MFVLDTDHLSLLQRGPPGGELVMRRLAGLASDQVATTIVNYEEQTRGWFSFFAKCRTLAQQIDGYRRLRVHLDHYRAIVVLDFDEAAAVSFQELQGQKIRISTSDLKIAAVVLANNATLVTRNRTDFQRVAGLRFEDWTK